ncbi:MULTISPECIES: hypothetical protein [Bacillus]|uniref:Uncharacterized protein n=1 Tax=Bacillus cereus TaxID=1396 RepID=A0A9X6YQE2_BACCE|nr:MULTISPECIES: hypothetical protein [Bacillus]MED1900001.1 hypothetical protein [Bacillus thuringiensis]MED2040221.1 hypothetical protein [Bacillus wiedmannii]PEQ83448.1 hypothetical protein CN475_23250 [Bacillus cereus]PFN46222.1 hypothetical protein COJ56_00495 [Bacillus thuringiensis]RFB51714.1 hypothetical protein DZB90_30250 [Bacillus thuringiensis]
MKITKYIGIGSMIWAIVFFIDYIYELFQINESGSVTTLTGLRITTEMTKEELNTQFALTWQALLMYIIFLIIWVVISLLINSRKQKNYNVN